MLIGTQQSILEKEPNDQPSKPTTSSRDEEISAVLEKNVDVDCFRVHLSEGDQIFGRRGFPSLWFSG
jgi:hypothetical protein